MLRAVSQPLEVGIRLLLRYRRGAILVIHAVLISTGFLTAFGLRFDFRLPAPQHELFWSTLPWLVLVRTVSLNLFGLQRGYWRHVGLPDLLRLAAAVSVSTGLFLGVLLMTGQFADMSSAVLLLDWILSVFLLGGVRLAVRCAREGTFPLRSGSGRRAFIVVDGGVGGEQLLRQLQHDARRDIEVVGLIDDEPAARHRTLHGVSVLGTTRELRQLAQRHRVELLVIAMTSGSGEQLRHVIGRCAESGLDFKIVPSLQELLDGRFQPGELRDVRVEDLLGRSVVSLDLTEVERGLVGRRVLITGGAGSIGSELARQIARFRPRQLVLVEQAESALYFTHLQVSAAHPEVDVVPVIADVADGDRLAQLFADYTPEFVFHAAAYKHVPLMECNAAEAVRNNIFGTLQVARCAAREGVGRFVLVSTDKAVNPASVMGATKRAAERLVLDLPALRDSATDFRAVRFGNVLGSDGSVVPLFQRQLAAGGPLTVTHPEVRRYFMTIPEAVQLLLIAATIPEAKGHIAMLEMGDPVRIADLAEQMIRLSGLTPHRDVRVAYTGLRPGEKLNEELCSQIENAVPTSVEQIRVVRTDRLDGEVLLRGLDRLEAALLCDEAVLREELRALVPEYAPRSCGHADRDVTESVLSSPVAATGRPGVAARTGLRLDRPVGVRR